MNYSRGNRPVESPDITIITSSTELWALAAWHRDLAETTDNPTIWESRLRTADNLEEMATRADRRPLIVSPDQRNHRQMPPLAVGVSA